MLNGRATKINFSFQLGIDTLMSLKKKMDTNNVNSPWGCRGRDHMVVGFIATYAVNAYHC